MSTAEILSLISLISYILAGVFLVVAVFCWFFFKIPVVIGNLSGRTAKKTVERMRQENARSGNKSYRSSAVNMERGKLTETMQPASRQAQPVQNNGTNDSDRPATGVLQENRAAGFNEVKTDVLNDPGATESLNDFGATESLSGCGATESLSELESTARLDGPAASGTQAGRSAAAAPNVAARRPGGKTFTMLNTVMLIHTDEVI